MNTVTFNFKLDVGNECYAIIKDKIMKCRVTEVWVRYNKKLRDESFMIEYCLADLDGCPCGVWLESEVFATKDELIRYIESV